MVVSTGNVLSRPKFHFTEEIVSTVVDEIERLGLFADAEELDIEMPDPKDRVLYEVVMEERKSMTRIWWLGI